MLPVWRASGILKPSCHTSISLAIRLSLQRMTARRARTRTDRRPMDERQMNRLSRGIARTACRRG
jgi:hypothetical protein